MNQWEKNAYYVEDTFGMFVDGEEGYYICPYCGEPVYEIDWSEGELQDYLCPICQDVDAEG